MSPSNAAVFETDDTITSWDDDYYHPISLRLYDAAVERMLLEMGVPAGSRILDAGCGPGVHSIRVAKAGHDVLGIDLSESMLGEARRRVSDAGLTDHVEFRQEDLTKLTLSDQSFDFVFSWGVIIHIPDVERAVSELARVVKPGGSLALYVTNQGALDHKFEDALRYLARKPLDAKSLPQGLGVRYEYHDQELWLWRMKISWLVDFLSQQGFELRSRLPGEFTEVQRRCRGFPRRMLLRLNNFYYRWGFPASLAVSNLLVFRKR